MAERRDATTRRVVWTAGEVRVGDVIAYPAVERRRGYGVVDAIPQPHDWLTVHNIIGRDIRGVRVEPVEGERDFEYTIFGRQIEANGVIVRD